MAFTKNYYNVSNKIFELNLQPNQFVILSYLIRLSHNNSTCYPSMNNIVEKCNVSKSTVVRTIKELESLRYITVEKKNKSNIYIINYDVIESNIDKEEVEEAKVEKEDIKENKIAKVVNYNNFKNHSNFSKNRFNDFPQRRYTNEEYVTIEQALLQRSYNYSY